MMRPLVSLLLAGLALRAGGPLTDLLDRHQASGPVGSVVLLKREGRTLLREARGMASLELAVPMREDQVFRIGSITKTFVATVVLQLVDEGRVDLDAPLATYLKDAPKAWEKVTVAHLLSHTSGIPDYLGGPQGGYGSIRGKRLSLDQLIAVFRPWPLQFEPGTAFTYSNSGYLLLGRLIEEVDGRAFPAALAARITGPLGLTHTRGDVPGALVPGLATGYTDGGRPAFLTWLDGAYSDGCMTSRVDDLAAFAEALHGGRLLKPATYQRMITPVKLRDGRTGECGLGLFVRRSGGRLLLGHGGDLFGFHGELEVDPEAHAVAVLLQNTDRFGARRSFAGDYLTRRLLAQAAGIPIPEPTPVALAPAQLAVLAGTYVGPEGRRVVTVEAGRLVSRREGGDPVILETSSPTTCYLPGEELRLRFRLEGGRAVSVQRYEDAGEEGAPALRQP
ncbi:MAG TPA: serine hydrolase domain-containing protein [Holophagaceae bacterium]|nr:serine hydrolase domain-containing protein [Holophagaceae bacterium]